MALVISILLAHTVTAQSPDSPSLTLGRTYYDARQWRLCLREALNALSNHPESYSARFLKSAASLRLGIDKEAAMQDLNELNLQAPAEIAAHATYERGLAFLKDALYPESVDEFSHTFLATTNAALHLKTSSILAHLLAGHPDIAARNSALQLQLRSFPRQRYADFQTTELIAPHYSPHDAVSAFGRALIGFYRAQISPAIGQRCSLTPSCSEYFLQATRSHGILGFAIQADRFVREPDVVSQKKRPVVSASGRTTYADPLSHHDFWLRKE